MDNANNQIIDDVTSAIFETPTDNSRLFYFRNLTDDGDVDESPPPVVWQTVLFGLLAAATSLVTIGGNLIVILSFIIERTIRQPSNYFIASLAVSDLLIGG